MFNINRIIFNIIYYTYLYLKKYIFIKIYK